MGAPVRELMTMALKNVMGIVAGHGLPNSPNLRSRMKDFHESAEPAEPLEAVARGRPGGGCDLVSRAAGESWC